MNNKEKLDLIKNFYNNLTDDEFKIRLEKAGFEIVESIPGQIIVDEEDIIHIDNPDFTVPTVVHNYQYKLNDFVSFSMEFNLGAIA